MQQLTFKRFLYNYLRDLSGLERLEISRLAYLAENKIPRLREPLLVYAHIIHNGESVQRLFANASLLEEYNHYFPPGAELTAQFFDTLPANYQKVYRSYIAVRDKPAIDNALKDIYRGKILALQELHNLSASYISEMIGIGHSPLCGFLYRQKNGNLSLNTVREVYCFLSSLDVDCHTSQQSSCVLTCSIQDFRKARGE